MLGVKCTGGVIVHQPCSAAMLTCAFVRLPMNGSLRLVFHSSSRSRAPMLPLLVQEPVSISATRFPNACLPRMQCQPDPAHVLGPYF